MIISIKVSQLKKKPNIGYQLRFKFSTTSDELTSKHTVILRGSIGNNSIVIPWYQQGDWFQNPLLPSDAKSTNV